MAGHGATRAAVRNALAMLCAEGLIERTQGVGTHAVVAPIRAKMEEALGVLRPASSALFSNGTRPRLLDRSTVSVPETLAGWLRVAPGTACLRLEYVSEIADVPIAIATNYVLFPEAGRLLEVPFRVDWYTLLAEAGVVLGESEFVMDSVLADELSSALLSVPPAVRCWPWTRPSRTPTGGCSTWRSSGCAPTGTGSSRMPARCSEPASRCPPGGQAARLGRRGRGTRRRLPGAARSHRRAVHPAGGARRRPGAAVPRRRRHGRLDLTRREAPPPGTPDGAPLSPPRRPGRRRRRCARRRRCPGLSRAGPRWPPRGAANSARSR